MNTERRMTPTGEITMETRADGSKAITGYAAVFHRADEPGTEYTLAKDLVERISPVAFNRAISEKHDARALFNHDPNMLLGRAGAGTQVRSELRPEDPPSRTRRAAPHPGAIRQVPRRRCRQYR